MVKTKIIIVSPIQKDSVYDEGTIRNPRIFGTYSLTQHESCVKGKLANFILPFKVLY
jgi:hypothetical protein